MLHSGHRLVVGSLERCGKEEIDFQKIVSPPHDGGNHIFQVDSRIRVADIEDTHQALLRVEPRHIGDEPLGVLGRDLAVFMNQHGRKPNPDMVALFFEL